MSATARQGDDEPQHLQARWSLASRLVLAATFVFLGFLAAVGAILEAAVRNGLEEAANQRLQAHVLTLLAVVEVDSEGSVRMPGVLPEPRLERPDSGLYAVMAGPSDRWVSKSAMGEDPELPDSVLEPGAIEFLPRFDIGPEEAYVVRQGITWETPDGIEFRFVLAVAEHERTVEGQLETFRRTLWMWMGAAALVLLALQLLVLRWGLKPVRSLASALASVKRGDREMIEQPVPRELLALTMGLNAFIASERRNLARYRNGLADLAHSLKTPLAVIRTGLDEQRSPELLDQVTRMDELVAYQLKRARAAGPSTLSKPIEIIGVWQPLRRALEKVYADRKIACLETIAADARFFGDRADLQEIIGNLSDNAFKWAAGRVHLSATSISTSNALRPGLELHIEDDGPGLPPSATESLLERGARADERVPGHGIGLAIVRDLIEAYGGEIRFETSALGGAAAVVTIPEE